jgi:hypothetical protein
MGSTFNLGLIIGTSTNTQYLTPNYVNLYDNLDARTALSFQLRMPTSATRPTVGQPVYLISGTGTVNVPTTNIQNYNFTGSTAINSDGWIGSATNYWYANISAVTGSIQAGLSGTGGLNYLVTGISAASSNAIITVRQNGFGYYSSNSIPVDIGSIYTISIQTMYTLTTSNGGYGRMQLYGGPTSSTMGYVAGQLIYGLGGANLSTTLSFTFTNSSNKFIDVVLAHIYENGTIVWYNLNLYKVSPNLIFGGSLENYTETCYPFTNELQLDCNAVDFTQMLNKRLVYKSYLSSGLGEYNLVNTTETFSGNGSNMVWQLSFPVQTTPTVLVDGFAASIGQKGVATSTYGYYYTPSSNLILANTSNSAPASSDTLQVTYSAIVGLPAWDSDIIRDINANYFNGEGINCSSTLGYVADGQRIPELNYNYMPGNEAINQICNITGYAWYIDEWKQLHYFPRQANNAPFNISSTSNNWRSLTVKHSRDKYRNKEYVLGSYGLISSTEQFKGDGYTKTWTLTYPVYSQPVITVDGYQATVGILGVSASTFGYYWGKETNQITGNSSNAALASSDWISIAYQGLYPVVAIAQDGDEINTRAAIELNSGIYEDAVTGNKTYVSSDANLYGSSILSKYGKPLDQVEFETDIDGLAAGQLINIIYPNNNLNDYYYIISVTARDVDLATMRYKVVAVSGTDRGGWVSFFRDLVAKSNQIYTQPYTNLVQTSLINMTGNVKFKDSGVTITATVLTIAYYDSGLYDTAVYT